MNTDQEGRPITAPYRSGRLEDGSYLAMSPQDIEAVARLLAGRGVRIRPPADLRGALGVTSFRMPDERRLANLDPLERAEAIRDRIQIRIREGEPVGGETFAHEVGHPIHLQMPGSRDRRLPRRRNRYLQRDAEEIIVGITPGPGFRPTFTALPREAIRAFNAAMRAFREAQYQA